MSNYIEEKLKEFEAKYYGANEPKIKDILEDVRQALQEQEERIKQEMKEKIEKGIGVLISSSKVEEYEKDIMFNTGKGCGLNFGISILNKLLKELNI